MTTVFGATDVGHVREENEDAFVISEIASGAVLPPTKLQTVTLTTHGVLLMVCDGMGGAAAGEVAAKLACETVAHELVEHRELMSGFAAGPALVSALRLANQAIREETRQHREERGMGTTCTAAIVREDRLIVAQVGDSRAYLLRAGQLRQLTTDQSLAEKMVEAGVLSRVEVKTYPHANVILQALGVEEQVDPVTTEIDLQPGDLVLVCSDGLHGPVPEDRIAEILRGTPELSVCARSLISAALDAGGPDNVSVVLARYDRAA